MMKNNWRVVIVLVLVLCLLVCSGCGSSEPDPNAGVYHAYTAEMMGFTIGIDEVYADGFSIELKNGGKCTITIGKDSASGKWTLDGNALDVSAGGVELSGILENSIMVFENAMDSGLDMVFVKEGTEAPEFVSITDLLAQMEDLVAEMENAK